MVVGLLGRKVGMTQIYNEAGEVIPVTVLEAGPCHVLQVRTAEKDKYTAIQLGFLDKPRRLASRSERGHVAKLESKRSKKLGAAVPAKPNCEPKRFVRELRGDVDGVAIGQTVAVNVFGGVPAVDVTGTTKGRGTAGVMKRHNFSGQRATHGVKKVHRHQGSTGCNSFPHHIFKGKRMAGHYGDETVTARNLRVVRIDAENNLLLVRGAVPGPNGGFVVIRRTKHVKPNTPPVAAPSKKKKK